MFFKVPEECREIVKEWQSCDVNIHGHSVHNGRTMFIQRMIRGKVSRGDIKNVYIIALSLSDKVMAEDHSSRREEILHNCRVISDWCSNKVDDISPPGRLERILLDLDIFPHLEQDLMVAEVNKELETADLSKKTAKKRL